MPSVFVGAYADTPPKVGWLAGLTGAIGRQLAKQTGTPTTRLRLPLGIDDTTAHVETTLGYRDAGAFYCQGEFITYTSRDACTFYGLVREQHVATLRDAIWLSYRASLDNAYPSLAAEKKDKLSDEYRDSMADSPIVVPDRIVYYPQSLAAHPVNTPIVCADRRWSVSDQARDDVIVGRAEGDRLKTLADDHGFPRCLATMTDDDLHHYLHENWYARRQPWMTAFNVFRWVFRYYEKAYTDGRVEVDGYGKWLVCPSLANNHLLDRWMYVTDGGEERLCRIKTAQTVSAETWVLLEPSAGPYWQASPLVTGHTGVAHRLVAFTFEYPCAGYDVDEYGGFDRRVGAELRLRVFAVPDDAPFVYLSSDTLPSPGPYTWPDDRPQTGCLLTNVDVSEDGCPHGFFVLNPFVRTIRGVGTDLVAAGVKLTPEVLSA